MSRLRQPGERSTLRWDWLLQHADQGLARSADTDRPRSVNLRRAVSSAYGVFHHVVLWVAEDTIPASHAEHRAEMCRMFAHKDIETVAKWVSGSTPPKPVDGLVDIARRSPGIALWADVFVKLKYEREDADYNHHAVVFDRPSVTMLVAQARDATTALDNLGHDDPAWRALVALCLLKVQANAKNS